MKYDPTIHQRKSFRLKGFDYSQNGAYFLTLCSYNRLCLFGKINDNKMMLNQFGMIVQNEWIKSFLIRAEIKMDEFVIMPNHFHGIVFIQNCRDHNKNNNNAMPIGPRTKSLSSLIAGFKSAVTKRINEIGRKSDAPVWQRNYHEHIIRNEKSLEKIREYVIHNPQTWEKDSLFSY